MVRESQKNILENIQGAYRTSLRPWLSDKQWYIIVGTGVIVFLIGCLGFYLSFKDTNPPKSLYDIAYFSVQLFALQSGTSAPSMNAAIEFARFAAPTMTIIAFLKFFASLFLDHFKRFWLGFSGGHVIICGLGYIGPVIADNFYRSGYHVVIIESDKENKNIEICKEKGHLVIIGDATKKETLKKANVNTARYVFCATGDDGLNADIAVMCHAMVKNKQRSKPLRCFIHMTDHKLCTLLIEKSWGSNDNNFILKFFNIYQTAGKSILKYYPPVDVSRKIPPDNDIMIVGLGRMGENILIQTARKWQNTYGNQKKLNFIVIDRDAENNKELLLYKYPFLRDICIIHSYGMELQSSEFYNGSYLLNKEGKCDVTRIYICLDDERLGLSAALYLDDLIRKLPRANNMPEEPVQIIVRTIRCGGITMLLNGLKLSKNEYSNISAFPIIDMACGKEIILSDVEEFIARAIHQEYVLAEEIKGKTPATNPSMSPWDQLPAHLKASNIQQAEHIWTKMDDINCAISMIMEEEPPFEFTESDIELLAKKEHERWCDEKIKKGWTYGPVRDDVNKKHPDLVPWEKLDDEEKEKDRNAIRTLPETLAKADLRIVRLSDKIKRPAEAIIKPEIICRVT